MRRAHDRRGRIAALTACLIWAFAVMALAQGNDALVSEPPQEIMALGPADPVGPHLSVPPGPGLRDPNTTWVETLLASMTLDDKIGQMLMPQWTSGSAPGHVTTYKVGGFIFLANSSTTIINAVNSLQAQTSVPLLFAIDCEAGSGARITDGTRFPMNMGLAATWQSDLACEQGRATARECRAVGIHIGFGPVLDVNTEPVNPIIGIRAYSDDPTIVAKMALSYVQGANEQGLLTTFKHFPGHGATTGDSHNSLPVVDISLGELQERHVKPYANLIATGAGDLVMSAHVWYPCLDPGPNAWPATLSTAAMTGILRQQLGFQGTVVSDSYGMAGLLQAASTYDAVRLGVLAGLDIILMPANMAQAQAGLRDAVTSGLIPMSRIDASVRRILTLKSRCGMPESTTVSATQAAAVLRHPDHLAAARAIGRKTICHANLRPGDTPLTATQRVLCLTLNASGQIFYLFSSSYFTNALAARLPLVTTQTVSTSISSSQRAAIVASVPNYDRVVVANYNWTPDYSSNQKLLVEALRGTTVPMVYVSFGSPYHVMQHPGLPNYFCAFSSHYDSQEGAAAVLTGEQSETGNWPVVLPGVATRVREWPAFN
jgi:beta-N-acetylhexosaminidase